MLNMIDAPKPEYIPKEIIDAALNYMARGRMFGKPVYIAEAINKKSTYWTIQIRDDAEGG